MRWLGRLNLRDDKSQHGRTGWGTDWALVIDAAVLYLLALMLHLDLGADGAEQHWKSKGAGSQRQGRCACVDGATGYSCTSVLESRSADWETEHRARNRRMSGRPNAVWGLLTWACKYCVIVGLNLGALGSWGPCAVAPLARASGRPWASS